MWVCDPFESVGGAKRPRARAGEQHVRRPFHDGARATDRRRETFQCRDRAGPACCAVHQASVQLPLAIGVRRRTFAGDVKAAGLERRNHLHDHIESGRAGSQERRALLNQRAQLRFLAFVAAGAVPLLPYVFSGLTTNLFAMSTVLSLAVLFVVGAARARIGTGSWWANGVEMLVLGVIVGAVAYYAGAVVSELVEHMPAASAAAGISR